MHIFALELVIVHLHVSGGFAKVILTGSTIIVNDRKNASIVTAQA